MTGHTKEKQLRNLQPPCQAAKREPASLSHISARIHRTKSSDWQSGALWHFLLTAGPPKVHFALIVGATGSPQAAGRLRERGSRGGRSQLVSPRPGGQQRAEGLQPPPRAPFSASDRWAVPAESAQGKARGGRWPPPERAGGTAPGRSEKRRPR